MRKPNASIFIRDDFLDWQCRMRQEVVRHGGGRPCDGMRPRVTKESGVEIIPAMTVLLLEKDPEATTDILHHIARKTHDSRKRMEEGLRILSASHYQHPENFSGAMTASFEADSPVAANMVQVGHLLRHDMFLPSGILIPNVLILVGEQNVRLLVPIHVGHGHAVADLDFIINCNGLEARLRRLRSRNMRG